MAISRHQINNVLRVYGNRLRQGRISDQPMGADINTPVRANINANARRETLMNDIELNIIKKINQTEPHAPVEDQVIKKRKSDHGKRLPIDESRNNEFIYKEINGNSETINSLSIEDIKFLTNK